MKTASRQHIEDCENKVELKMRLLSEYLLNCTDDDISAQFLVDCSILPNVISAYQQLGSMVHEDLFRITRTWCRSLHVDRIKLLGRYYSLK